MKVKTKEYLEKENKMLKKCVEKVIDAYINNNSNNKSIDRLYHDIFSETIKFYKKNETPIKRKCNKCGCHIIKIKSFGDNCVFENCDGKLIIEGNNK